MSSIGERLKKERKMLGYTQPDFAELGGVKKTAQINYEKGARNPDAAYLSSIAKHGADVQYILTGIRSHAGEFSFKLDEADIPNSEGKLLEKTVSNDNLKLARESRNSVSSCEEKPATSVNEKMASYTEGEQPKKVGTISEEEAVLVRKYRELLPEDRTHAQAVVGALADAKTHKNVEEK